MNLQELERTIEGADIIRTALGNVVMIWSPNDLDVRAVCITPEGVITHDETINWDEGWAIPTPQQFTNWAEVWSDKYSFFTFIEKEIKDATK